LILDKKIEKVQNKILNSNKSDFRKVRIFNIIIKKLNIIESNKNINSETLELVKYIKNEFETKVLEFKTEKNLINKLIFSSEI